MFNFELVADDLCTHGYHIMDNFLETNHYDTLISTAQTIHHQEGYRKAKIGLPIQVEQNNSIRTDSICWLDDILDNLSINYYLTQIDELKHYLNQSLFLGLTEFESHFAAYQPGDFYKIHVDQFHSQKTRKISCVYYLNRSWDHEFGGELRLYNQENERIQDIIPYGNRFICFNSQLPHEVLVTRQPRFSITGWIKTRQHYDQFSLL